MIEKINHKVPETAANIRAVFQASYPVEAALLQAKEFPPLKRSIQDFLSSETEFYCYRKDGRMLAVMEIRERRHSTHIQSLVVDPKYFRQGIARQLINFVLNTYNNSLFTVETGAKNQPAISLYERSGFSIVSYYHSNFGIRKVRLEKRILSE